MMTHGATIDFQIIYALFTRTIFACDKLNLDKDFVADKFTVVGPCSPGSFGLCALDARPHAMVLGPGIKVCFLPFLGMWSFWPRWSEHPHPWNVRTRHCIAREDFRYGVNPRDGPGRGRCAAWSDPATFATPAGLRAHLCVHL